MSSQHISRKGRTSRTYSLIGTGVILTISLFIVMTVVDVKRKLHAKVEHSQSILAGGIEPTRNAMLDVELDRVGQKMEQIEASMVGAEQLDEIQSELMDIALATRCKLQRSVTEDATTESWVLGGDDNNDTGADAPNMGDSPFELTTHQLSLNLTGNAISALEFIKRIRGRKWMMTFGEVTFSKNQNQDQDDQISLEMGLVFKHLRKKPTQKEQPLPDNGEPPPLPPDAPPL